VTPVSSPIELDGRTARRHRNTDAVLDAVHELFVEGHLLPTVEDVALRSGVSLRSVYRYFPDRQELLRAALWRRMQVAESYFSIGDVGEGTLEERIERFADHRIDLYDKMAPTARAALSAAPGAPVIADVVRQRKAQLTEETRRHFGPELDSSEQADDVLAAIDVLCQFESVEALRLDRGYSPARIRRVIVTGVSALLRSGKPA
jgi:TetR/AcrR family transcriptional regulator, regulator of autoinduction and epiphytic fitness